MWKREKYWENEQAPLHNQYFWCHGLRSHQKFSTTLLIEAELNREAETHEAGVVYRSAHIPECGFFAIYRYRAVSAGDVQKDWVLQRETKRLPMN